MYVGPQVEVEGGETVIRLQPQPAPRALSAEEQHQHRRRALVETLSSADWKVVPVAMISDHLPPGVSLGLAELQKAAADENLEVTAADQRGLGPRVRIARKTPVARPATPASSTSPAATAPGATAPKVQPASAPRLDETNASEVADRARALQAMLRRHFPKADAPISQCVRAVVAEASGVLPEPHIVGLLAKVEVARAAEAEGKKRSPLTMTEAVRRVRQRFGAPADDLSE